MRWSNLPSVVKAIDSQVSRVDQDGNVNYQPLLRGKNSLIEKRGTIGGSAAASADAIRIPVNSLMPCIAHIL